MRTLFGFIWWMALVAAAPLAANPLAATEQDSPAQGSLETLTCNFTQERVVSVIMERSISQGFMAYQAPQNVCWKYTYPTISGFVSNANGHFTITPNGLQPAQGSAAGLFGMIGQLVLLGMDPEALKSSKDFAVTESQESTKKVLVLELVPLRRDLKRFLSRIVLRLRATDHVAQQIRLEELRGDFTIITFTNHQINTPIDASVFQ